MTHINDDNILYLCSDKRKEIILEQSSLSAEIKNIKYMNKQEFMKEYFFDYDVVIFPYLMETYHISFSISKEYLNNLYYINVEENYDSPKLNFLKELKQDLLSKKLLQINHQFKNYLQQKKIIVDYSFNCDPFLNEILISLNSTFLTRPTFDKELTVTKTHDIEEEVNNVIIEILTLVDKGVELNHIYLSNVNDDYFYILDKLFSLYNIPLELNQNISLNSIPYIKEYFITKKLPELNSENGPYLVPFINLLNKYASITDSPFYKTIIKAELNQTFVTKQKYQESVKVIDFDNLEVTNQDYVFILGFNETIIPKLVKDEYYLSDKEKEMIGLYPSYEQNKITRNNTYLKIASIMNVYLSYKLHSFSDEYYPSSIIEDFNIKTIEPKENKYIYSDKYNLRKLALLKDRYNKYKEEDANLKSLAKTYPNSTYNTFNHKYTSISNTELLDYISKPLKLSYTSMNQYNLCPFSYYIKNILKLDPFSDSFQAYIGSLYHYILSKCFADDFDFEYEWQQYTSKKTHTPKENFLLKRLKNELLIVIDILKEQKLYTDFKSAIYEKEITIPIENQKIDTLFTGIIDKIMYYQNLSDTYYAVVDYKTGSFPSNINNMKYGLDMQLPIYLYLIEKKDIFTNPIFTGMYFQNISLGNIKKRTQDYSQIIQSKLKLKGYSIEDNDILQLFDHNFTKSNIIAGMSVTDKGFGRYAKVLNSEDIYNIIKYTDKIIKESLANILDGNFAISPKVISDGKQACQYCKYKDLCFKTEEDMVYLEKVEDLSFLGGDTNG